MLAKAIIEARRDEAIAQNDELLSKADETQQIIRACEVALNQIAQLEANQATEEATDTPAEPTAPEAPAQPEVQAQPQIIQPDLPQVDQPVSQPVQQAEVLPAATPEVAEPATPEEPAAPEVIAQPTIVQVQNMDNPPVAPNPLS